jgi:ankyrin repeat protein
MRYYRILAAFLLLCVLIPVNTSAQTRNIADAAKNQDWESVETRLAQGDDPDMPQPDGTTALAWAVYWDNQEVAQELIRRGADVNAGNYIGVTPLILAVRNRNITMVGNLLEAGANPDVALWSGETALMAAARSGVTGIMQLLLESGAKINTQDPRRGQSALMWAISFGHPEAASMLIEQGADISARTKKLEEGDDYTPMLMEGYGGNVESIAQGGYTPLMFAAKSGDAITTELLLKKGADINAVAVEDGSALVIASAEGYESIAMKLLENGADPNIADANGMTALHYAMRDGFKSLVGYVKISAARVCGFNWDTLCKYMETITDEEKAELKKPGTGLYIVEGESDSNSYERDNRMLLPGGNMYELAEALLAKGANVNAAIRFAPPRVRLEKGTWMNLAGATPYFLALASQDETAMVLLLEHGANPLVTTTVNEEVFLDQTKVIADDNQVYGNASSLMLAAGLGKKEMFTAVEEKKAYSATKKLIELGADVNQTTATGWTALHAAAYLGAASLVELLIEHGARIDALNGCGRSAMSLALAENNIGLIRGFKRNDVIVDLLRKHGASEGKPSGAVPAGKCVLGRFQL